MQAHFRCDLASILLDEDLDSNNYAQNKHPLWLERHYLIDTCNQIINNWLPPERRNKNISRHTFSRKTFVDTFVIQPHREEAWAGHTTKIRRIRKLISKIAKKILSYIYNFSK